MLAYAAAIVRRGEATGEVVATGLRTYFGKTAELVRTAKSASHLQRTIFSIVKTLIIVDALLVCVLLVYAAWAGLPFTEVVSIRVDSSGRVRSRRAPSDFHPGNRAWIY